MPSVDNTRSRAIVDDQKSRWTPNSNIRISSDVQQAVSKKSKFSRGGDVDASQDFKRNKVGWRPSDHYQKKMAIQESEVSSADESPSNYKHSMIRSQQKYNAE